LKVLNIEITANHKDAAGVRGWEEKKLDNLGEGIKKK
jgi:hypothetical protein